MNCLLKRWVLSPPFMHRYFCIKPPFNYHSVLGLDFNASPEQIKAAYYKLSLKYHPDHNAGNKTAVEKFRMITEAYTALNKESKQNGQSESSADRSTSNASKKPFEGIYKGRTKEFNYDEYYDAHYGDQYEKKKQLKQCIDDLNKRKKFGLEGAPKSTSSEKKDSYSSASSGNASYSSASSGNTSYSSASSGNASYSSSSTSGKSNFTSSKKERYSTDKKYRPPGKFAQKRNLNHGEFVIEVDSKKHAKEEGFNLQHKIFCGYIVVIAVTLTVIIGYNSIESKKYTAAPVTPISK